MRGEICFIDFHYNQRDYEMVCPFAYGIVRVTNKTTVERFFEQNYMRCICLEVRRVILIRFFFVD